MYDLGPRISSGLFSMMLSADRQFYRFICCGGALQEKKILLAK
jgi:hypothetical protein